MSSELHESKFLDYLRNEKLRTLDARARYTLNKLAYATALLGLGSLQFQSITLNWLLYLVPFVAFACDLYIMAEDHSVKRIGAFLRAHSHDSLEQEWEKWATRTRDRFAPLAMPVLTTLLLLGSTLLIVFTEQPPNVPPNLIQGLVEKVSKGPLFLAWLLGSLVLTWGSYFGYLELRRSTEKKAQICVLSSGVKLVLHNEYGQS